MPIRSLRPAPRAPLADRPASRLAESPPVVAGRSPSRRSRADAGQAAVELVALLPLLVALCALAWQLVIAGHAVWAVHAAARTAARAHAIGLDARAAARARLPAELRGDLRVGSEDDGTVRVAVRIPAILGLYRLGDASAHAHFEPQR